MLVHVGKGRGEGLHDFVVQGANSFLQFATRVTYVGDLGVEVLITLLESGELLESQGINRTERTETGFEFREALLQGHAVG